ncbi:MAG: DUF1800 domain-containing protein [Rhodobacteraceae bacterium]|nr:DUF1800 domain-containing protein [Paracoccaceae bacterium]
MRFDPQRAAIRFGCGLSPKIAPPSSVAATLALLQGADNAAADFPIPGFEQTRTALLEIRQARRGIRKAPTDAERDAARKYQRQLRRKLRADAVGWFRQGLLRRAFTEDGFRERLTFFWADHFTAKGDSARSRDGVMPYVEEAIRPHVAGRFADMLKSVVTHPVMLDYLDQIRSVGPNSDFAQKRQRNEGVNENFARELLELHIMGADGPHTQADIRQMAKLLTGLHFDLKRGFTFRGERAEPGAETVLGQSYGGGPPRLADIFDALEHLVRHPATARHIARKLAVHFVSDTPDTDLLADLAAAFTQTEGDLIAVYEVLLSHPAAWRDGPGNVKQPIDFIGSSLRALDLVPRHVPTGVRALRRVALGPLTLMGQDWTNPVGPDGWPEADADWITPQRMAARIHWAMSAPFLLRRVLPDPRDFVQVALGGAGRDDLIFAARAAETRAEGIGIILASPQFQRT